MKKLVWIVLGASLSLPSYAWDGGTEDMNTMNDNMSGQVVRVVRSYSGMPRGWTDNAGFRHGGYVHKPHVHTTKKLKHKRKHKKSSSRRVIKRHKAHKSGVCIAKCYCDTKH